MENEYFSVPSHQLSYNNYREKFYTGKLSPEVQLLTFYVSFLHKRYSFRIPFHSSLMVEGSSGLLQAFYSQSVFNKVFRGEALPRFPFSYLSMYHFCQKGCSFRIPNHPSWRLRGGVACCRHFKMSSDHTRVNREKDCVIKIKLVTLFCSFFFLVIKSF